MPIKLNVSIEEFAKAARNFDSPLGPGDIVYGWDNNSSVLVMGAHMGFEDEFDPMTGARIKHRHKILVMSWQVQETMLFDYAATVPRNSRMRVITPDGTGRLDTVTDDRIGVLLDNGQHVLYSDPDKVQLFSWARVSMSSKPQMASNQADVPDV